MARPRRTKETVGERIRRFREDARLSPSELADLTSLSRSYLSELETGTAQNPSADTLYRLARALGVAMSDVLGKPILLLDRTEEPTPSLVKFAKERNLPETDIHMLARIEFRGEKPRTTQRWAFIYDAIRNSSAMDK